MKNRYIFILSISVFTFCFINFGFVEAKEKTSDATNEDIASENITIESIFENIIHERKKIESLEYDVVEVSELGTNITTRNYQVKRVQDKKVTYFSKYAELQKDEAVTTIHPDRVVEGTTSYAYIQDNLINMFIDGYQKDTYDFVLKEIEDSTARIKVIPDDIDLEAAELPFTHYILKVDLPSHCIKKITAKNKESEEEKIKIKYKYKEQDGMNVIKKIIFDGYLHKKSPTVEKIDLNIEIKHSNTRINEAIANEEFEVDHIQQKYKEEEL